MFFKKRKGNLYIDEIIDDYDKKYIEYTIQYEGVALIVSGRLTMPSTSDISPETLKIIIELFHKGKLTIKV